MRENEFSRLSQPGPWLEEVETTEDDKPAEHSEDELEDFQRTDEERQPDLDTENILKVCFYQPYIVISIYFYTYLGNFF